jgi:uncharacterized protein YjbI with pentapeptide repeats
MGTRRCAYQGKKILEIESEWIKNEIKDKVELDRRIKFIEHILDYLMDKANCRFYAIEGKEFCIFHDPNYWKTNEKEVREKFLEELNKGESYFVGFHLPSIKLPEVIKQPLHMDLVKIHAEFNANGVHFNGVTWFNGAIFNKIASFNGATFDGETWFNGAIFNGEAWFFEAIFDGETWFNGAIFNGETLFSGARFKIVRFEEAKFNGETQFGGATFKGETSFSKTIFNGEAWFFEAIFDGVTWFNGAIFNKIASFFESQFRNKTIFDDSFFSGEVSFKNTIFLIGSINNSKYTDYISFRRVTFKEPEKVIFDGCNMKRVSFLHSDISRIKFINTKWGKDFRIFDEKLFLLKLNKKEFIKEQKKFLKKIINFTKSIKLDDVVEAFEKGIVEISEEMEEIICEPVIYEKLALMKEYKDEKKVKEYNEKKKELEQYYKDYIKKDYINKLKNKLNQIDKDIENEIKNLEDYGLKDLTFKELTLDNVLTVYRNLRENYDYYMKYEESGKFFLNEMKLKRKTLPKLSGEKIVMLLYEALALYGESYIRPLLALIAIMMTSFFIRLYVHQFDPNVIFDELLKSIDLFGLGSVSGSIDIIERLVAIPILGMLIVALRRKLERRVRH